MNQQDFMIFEIRKTRFQSLLTGIWLSKSLKNLSDHLNIFGSHKGRSQLSPAVFRASRTYVVAQKSWKQFQTPLKLRNPWILSHGFDPKIQTDSFGNTSKCKHLTLGIYATNSIAKAFARIQSKKGRKFAYMYKCKGENFSQMMNQIGAFGRLRWNLT